MINIGCILVLYKPAWDLTERVIAAILPQVDKLYIVDNSPEESYKSFFEEDKVEYKYLGGNLGIAAAQNVGLDMMRKDKFNYCFFLDQDSVVEADMVKTLYSHFTDLTTKGVNVGAVGPRPVNRQLGKEYRGSVKKGKVYNESITEVTELINSASFIPIDNFNKSGDMDASLFIDGVDHEWCWRCTKKTGGRFFICEDTHLSHQLGEGDRTFMFKKVAIPTPFRTYYQYRNYFILVRRNYVPLYWKLSNGLKYFIKMFYYPLFIQPKKAYLKNISKGIKDGIRFMINGKR